MRPLTPAQNRALEIAQARLEAQDLRAERPDVRAKVVESLLPDWLATRYLDPLKRAGGLMLAGAPLSLIANLNAPWYFHAVDILLLVLGLATLWGVRSEIHFRRAEATRLREYGPDEYDTIVDAGVRVATRPWWRNVLGRLFDLAVLALPVLTAVRAWSDDSWPTRIAAVAAVCCVVAGSVYYLLAARTGGGWRRDFLAEEGLTLPPLRDEWHILLR